MGASWVPFALFAYFRLVRLCGQAAWVSFLESALHWPHGRPLARVMRVSWERKLPCHKQGPGRGTWVPLPVGGRWALLGCRRLWQALCRRRFALAAAMAEGAPVALAAVANDDDEAQHAHDGDEGDVLEDVHGGSFRRDSWSLLFVDPILPRGCVRCHRPGLRLSYGLVSQGFSA